MRRLLVLGAAALLVLGACGSGDPESSPPTTKANDANDALSLYEGPPPWPVADRQADRMERAGVPLLRAEGKVVHYHAHLDVFYDGEEVTVPANIGLDYERQVISPMHTHYDTGVIHVEADEEADFTLGQFLTEWGVKNGEGCVADKCGDEVAVFIDGSIQDDDAADVVIDADTEIALVLGTKPADIPSGYDCAAAPQDACPNTPKP
jgi:hypothetical protein